MYFGYSAKGEIFQMGIRMHFVCPPKYDIEIQKNSLCKCEFLFKHLKHKKVFVFVQSLNLVQNHLIQ